MERRAGAGDRVAGTGDNTGSITRIEDARCLADLERLFGIAHQPDEPGERRPFYRSGANDLGRDLDDDGELVDERRLNGEWTTDGDGQRRFVADDARHVDWTR